MASHLLNCRSHEKRGHFLGGLKEGVMKHRHSCIFSCKIDLRGAFEDIFLPYTSSGAKSSLRDHDSIYASEDSARRVLRHEAEWNR